MKIPEVVIKKGKQRSIDRFHPWVFSGAIQHIVGDPADGDVVEITDHQGKIRGTGFFSNGSIAVRLVSFDETEINEAFWYERISAAWALRKQIGLAVNPETDIFRLIHAEGDHLPGLIADVYGKVAVLQAHHAGIHRFRNEIAKAIVDTSEGRITSVYYKSSDTLPKNIDAGNGFILGDQETKSLARENNHSFEIDWQGGQKTGFFIDQRENRQLLATYSSGKKVLNTFCYTGGFSVYALVGGATLVHSVDSSQQALEGCLRNVELAKNKSGIHEAIKADAVQYVKELPDDYDIIVLDPPAFAKHLKAKHRAVQAYKRLNAHAIRQIKPGGIIFTFSCSQVVDKVLFSNTVLAAAIECGRSVRILHQLHQPADHPVNIFHPESEYLKGLVLQID